MKGVCVALCFCCLLVPALAQLRNIDIQQVVNDLGERFENIRNEGLGIDNLEEAYRNAEFNFDPLTEAEIDSFLSDEGLTGPVEAVTELFDNITNGRFVNITSIDPPECCNNPSSLPCCSSSQCFPGSLEQELLLQDITGAFNQFQVIPGEQLFFGHVSGVVLTEPPLPCENVQDSRAQRWFRESLGLPLEVVIMIDTSELGIVGAEHTASMRAVANEILNSLTQQDRVAVVRADIGINILPILTRLSDTVDPQTAPVCDEIIQDMEQFVNSQSQVPANYTNGLVTSARLFTDSPDTRKVMVVIVPGITSGDIGIAQTMFAEELTRRGIQVLVNVYRGVLNGVPSIDRSFDSLLEISLGGGVNEVTLGFPVPANPPAVQSLIGPFYAPHLNATTFTPGSTSYSRTADDAGNSFVSVARGVFDLGRLVGVLYAMVPVDGLLSAGLSQLAGRASSYLFIVDSSQRLLYHPLLPGDTRKDVLVTDIEGAGVIDQLLSSTSPSDGSSRRSEVNKVMLLPSTGARSGFVLRAVSATYTCRPFTGGNDICSLVANEDLDMATLNQATVDIRGIYSSDPQRLPLYSNLPLSAPTAESCDYFCKPTISNRVSFQLTGANTPPMADSQQLVDELSDYIRGTGSRPSGVSEGVAEEIALASAVVSSWINQNTTASNYITRRHLASPSGVYLTYPPAQFVSNYNPLYSPWYTASEAHPSLLTLTPPTASPLEEGSRFTVAISYTVRSPLSASSDLLSGGQTLSVVSADVTLDTLRAFLRQSLPQCEGNSQLSCFIIDDLGNIIYDQELVETPGYSGGDTFFLEQTQSARYRERRALMISLLNQASENKIIQKVECEDYFTSGIETLRFHHLDTTFNSAVSEFNAGGCINYAIQRIPDTNAFMVVIEGTNCLSQFCFCSDTGGSLGSCNNCEAFSATGCECPCFCSDCPDRVVPLACPKRLSSEVNYELAVSALATPNLGTCFNQNCNCRTTLDSCLGVRECSWCSAQQKCVYNTECCDASETQCCARPPQIQRFNSLTCDLEPVCNAGSPMSVCPTTPPDNTAPQIAAGVVGGIFAVLLIALIVALFVWYQFFRREDPNDERNRESAFDFSKKKTGVNNPTALEEAKSNNSKPASPTAVAPAEEEKKPLDEHTSM